MDKICREMKYDCYDAFVDCNKCDNYIETKETKMPEPYKTDFINFNVDPNRCTCLNCDWETNNCEFKFDLYNTDGDCLMEK